MCCVHMLNNVSRKIEVSSVKGPYAPLPFVFSPKVPPFPQQYGLTMTGPLNSPFIRNTSHIHTCRYIHVHDYIIGYMHIGVSTCYKCIVHEHPHTSTVNTLLLTPTAPVSTSGTWLSTCPFCQCAYMWLVCAGLMCEHSTALADPLAGVCLGPRGDTYAQGCARTHVGAHGVCVTV